MNILNPEGKVCNKIKLDLIKYSFNPEGNSLGGGDNGQPANLN